MWISPLSRIKAPARATFFRAGLALVALAQIVALYALCGEQVDKAQARESVIKGRVAAPSGAAPGPASEAVAASARPAYR